MRLGRTKRISSPCGGIGHGYELTDPDYVDKRIARMRAEYYSLEPKWRAEYLKGVSDSDRRLMFPKTGER
jgi:hypothetical protein